MKSSDRKFLKEFEEKVYSTIKKHKLINPDDNVLVAVSGGKDSTTTLFVLKKLGFNVSGMIIDQLLGEYSRKNLENIKDFCAGEGIKLHVVHMRDEFGCSVCYMQSVLADKGVHINACTICGVIRRNILNKKGRKLKASCIATGHNLDDEAQTVFMNFIQGNVMQSARLGPKTGLLAHKKFIPRIKPLYFCTEAETERYSRLNEFPVVYDPCPCSLDSFRSEVKSMLNRLEGEKPDTKKSIIYGFLKVLPELKKQAACGVICDCDLCGEPSSKKICKTCELLSQLSS
ncbi:MAG: TIGR00269 family protein [Methanobacteriota archaeon]